MTGSPTIAGDLTIASGTLSPGSNNLTVGGNWWNLGAMFIGTGTVTLNGSGSGNAIRSAGQDFGALTVNGSGSTWTANDRLSVSGGALTLTSGTLNSSGYTVRAGSIAKTSGTFTSTGSTLILDGGSNAALPATTAGALRVEDPTETNLVGYWKFDNAQGTTFRDYSGSANTGTLVGGASWVTSSLPSIRVRRSGCHQPGWLDGLWVGQCGQHPDHGVEHDRQLLGLLAVGLRHFGICQRV